MCNCNKVWQVGWSKRRERIVESARSLQIVQLHANVNTEITENYKKVTTNYKKKKYIVECQMSNCPSYSRGGGVKKWGLCCFLSRPKYMVIEMLRKNKI